MIIQHLNWLAVAVSAIVYFSLGAVWFNQKVFGTIWLKGHNLTVTEEDKKNMGKVMLITLICCFIGSICSGYLVYAINSWTWGTGLKIGLVAGIGFAGMAIAMNHMYTKKSFTLAVIDSMYHVVGISIACIILSVWR